MFLSYFIGAFCLILLVEGGLCGIRCPFLSGRAGSQPSAEQNAADASCSPPSRKCNSNDIYYTMDGSCNNLNIPSWGQVGTPYVRLLPANYSDGISKFRTSVKGGALPQPRAIRSAVIPDNNDVLSSYLNIMFYGFGQFVDHDVTLARSINSSDQCCINNKPAPNMREDICLPTIISSDDPFYKQFQVTCVDFKRIINTQTNGCNNVRPISQINSQTAFMDLSVTYGTNDRESRALRTRKGGLLKVTNSNRTSGQEYPPIASGSECITPGGVDRRTGGDCFLAGDERVNQNPELLVVDVIFLKLHNFIAKNLQSINPKWDDERLFKEARRICIAIYQHVITSEYLPILIGPKVTSLYKLYPASSGYVRGYDPNLNPQTLESYSAAVGRAGHSNIVGHLRYFGPDERQESYLLRDKFFNNSFVLRKNMFSSILQAYVGQPCSRQDQIYTQEITNWMFHNLNERFGFDLAAVDILRGRDFGLQPYNKFREACGLCKLQKFEDLAKEIKRPEDIGKLKSLYKSVEDIDYYVGGLMEKPLPDATVGQSFACIQAESFYRWKFGDRLFYEFPEAKFTLPQLQTIRRTSTLSEIICLTNPWLESIQMNSFLIESAENHHVSCEDIPKINLNFWKEK